MAEKEEKQEKPEKHESKIREYEVEFVLKDKSSKQKFNTAQEIYLLYVHCSKVFQCGLFSLYFNGINLNFIEKNSKLSTIFKKDTKNPRIIVMVKDNQLMKKRGGTEVIQNIETKKNICVNIEKGTLSQNFSEISNNDYIDEISLTDEKMDENEIPCFFSQIANKNINKLSINVKFLMLIDSMNLSINFQCFNNLKELVIQSHKEKNSIIKAVVYEIKNTYFPNLKKLHLINVSVDFFKKQFENLEKLQLNNAYINLQIPITFNSLSFLGLNYIYCQDIYDLLDFVMKKAKTVDILKLKLYSIDFMVPFNFTDFCYTNQKNIEKVKNIELNLKSKFIFEEPDAKDKKKCVDKFLRKTTKLKLTPFSKFTEKELAYFSDKLSNINLLKLELINIEKEKELIKFLDNYPDLEYISLDEKYNYLIPSKIYKLNIHSIDDIIKNKIKFKNFINGLKIDKLEKIEMPFFEFNRELKHLKILGDFVPLEEKKDSEDQIKITDLEDIFILLKKLLFNIPYIEKLTLQNFESENKAIYLNNFLIGFMNLLSSPKINKLKLIDVCIDKGLVDKFSFIFMNSSACLRSLELNNINIETEEMQFLFYTLLFQIEYQNLATLKLINLNINQTFVQVIEEYNIFRKVDHLELDSITNFELIKDIIFNLDTNTGISLKNLKITEEELTNYLITNGDYLRKVVLDLEGMKLYDVLNNDKISFKDTRVLKIYESFDNYDDDTKFKFLENKWLKMKKLRKLYMYIKSNSHSNQNKEKELISLFKYLKNII